MRPPNRLLVLLAGLAVACSQPEAPPSGDIAGKVTIEGGDLRGVIVSIPGTLAVPAADGTFAFKTLPPGSYTVSASKDGFVTASADAAVTKGATAQVELALKAVPVENSPPVVVSVLAVPPAVAPGGTATLTAVARDPEEGALTYAWTVPEGWKVTGEGAQVTVTAPKQYGQTALVALKVTDAGGLAATGSATVTTVADQAPIFSSVVALPNPATPGGTVKLTASAMDPNGDALTYTWAVDGATDAWTVTGEGAQVTVTAPQKYGATATATVTADDGFGLKTSASLVLTTVGDQAPIFSSIVALPNPAKPGAPIALTATAADPNGDALTYTWVVESAGDAWVVTGTGAQVTVTAPRTYGATATARVTADDGNGQKTTASLALATTADQAPLVQGITALPLQAGPGEEVTLTAAATDPDGDPLTYAWTAPSGWTFKAGSDTANVVLVAPSTYGASGAASVVVSDGLAQASASVVVATRPDRAPSIASIAAQPNPVFRGGTVTVDVSANDPDGDALTYAWTAPAGWVLTGTGAHVTLKAPDKYGERGTVKVVVSDGVAPGIEAQVPVSTAANRAPVLSSLVANGSPALKGGNIALSASVADPDGDTLTYTWSAPAAWTLTPNGANCTVKAPDLQGQSALVTLVVKDGAGGEVTGQVAVATTPNRAPVVTDATVNAPTTDRKGTLTASVTALDPDGDALTYTWKASAGWTVAGSGKNATVTAPDAYDRTGTITVTVSDGVASQDATLPVATRSDRLPVIAGVTVTPTPLLPGAAATFAVNATDADGEALTYTYTVDASNWTVTGTGASVSLRAPRVNAATVNVTVKVDDQYGGVATRVVPVTASSCPTSTMNCDGDATNGCEAQLSQDPNNCGICDNHCAAPTPACVANVCSAMDTRSCKTIHDTAPTAPDGTYSVDPDGTGPAPAMDVYCDQTTAGGGWTRCLEFVNTSGEDVNNNTWFDKCVDYASASWASTGVLVRLTDAGGVVRYVDSGTRPSGWTYDQLTSTIDPGSQYYSPNHNRLVSLTGGDKVMIAGRNSSNSGCGGSMGNGYGIVVYPSSPNYYSNPKIFVFPYRHQVAATGARSFSGWSTSSEVSFASGTFNSCSAVAPFLGKFELYVR